MSVGTEASFEEGSATPLLRVTVLPKSFAEREMFGMHGRNSLLKYTMKTAKIRENVHVNFFYKLSSRNHKLSGFGSVEKCLSHGC